MFLWKGDAIVMETTERESEFLRQIPLLLESVGAFPDDPGHAVLHRPVYIDEPTVDEDVFAFISAELDVQRAADRSVLERCCTGTFSMSVSEAQGFVRSINEARLVLAARAGAFEDGSAWEDRIDDDPALAAVAWLGYVQADLINVLTADR